jgi:hypothetical protein
VSERHPAANAAILATAAASEVPGNDLYDEEEDDDDRSSTESPPVIAGHFDDYYDDDLLLELPDGDLLASPNLLAALSDDARRSLFNAAYRPTVDDIAYACFLLCIHLRSPHTLSYLEAFRALPLEGRATTSVLLQIFERHRCSQALRADLIHFLHLPGFSAEGLPATASAFELFARSVIPRSV